jgi:hypothetical protein
MNIIHPLGPITFIRWVAGASGGIGGIGKNGWRMLAPKTTKISPSRMRQMSVTIFMKLSCETWCNSRSTIETGPISHLSEMLRAL